MTSSVEITPVTRPIVGAVRPPGSKSLTNRAFVLGALAKGITRLDGILDSDDTRVMAAALAELGFAVDVDWQNGTAAIHGGGGSIPAPHAELFLENSGTSIRFLTALCAVGRGRYQLDGIERMRERPIGDLVDGLNQLGANVRCAAKDGFPPIIVESGQRLRGTASVSGATSSQFLSALLMVAPMCDGECTIRVVGNLVSQPYVSMTLRMMQDFGVVVTETSAHHFLVREQAYQSRSWSVEPDASAASYFMAAAAITGGRIEIRGLNRGALQGDVKFAEALESMGCRITWAEESITVAGPARLTGIDLDMNEISDTAQTLAVVAVFADSPTTIRNVSHIRHKETDRVSAVVDELRRLGVRATVRDDGLQIEPGPVTPASIRTYNDHRMAMSFSLIGLRAGGIRIENPECTAKTYPAFFDDLQAVIDASESAAP